MKISIVYLISSCLVMFFIACKNDVKSDHTQHDNVDTKEEIYTCPMHPQVIRDKPGSCPICGMDLVKKETDSALITSVELTSLLRPTNEYVISTIPVTAIKKDQISLEIDATGRIEYDTRMIGNISARINGRIEKLYVRHTNEYIKKGQIIMDIYRPELMTAQQNLLFVLKNDASNVTLIEASKQKLLLLGMSTDQVQKVVLTGNPLFSVSVYSNISGHLHNAGDASAVMNPQSSSSSMKTISPSTELLNLKEGMYVQKGQNLFSIYNPSKVWAMLNIYTEGQGIIQKGQFVKITPETAPDQSFQGRIDFIEPFYREGSRTTSVRVYFDNSSLGLPVGSQVRGLLQTKPTVGYWLPKESVTALGSDRIVFLKVTDGFKPKKVTIGIIAENSIQIIEGLSATDSIARNAQFLIDSESFIKVKE